MTRFIGGLVKHNTGQDRRRIAQITNFYERRVVDLNNTCQIQMQRTSTGQPRSGGGVMTYYWSGLPVTVIEKINLLVDSLLKQMQDCAVGYWGMRIVATDMAVVSC